MLNFLLQLSHFGSFHFCYDLLNVIGEVISRTVYSFIFHKPPLSKVCFLFSFALCRDLLEYSSGSHSGTCNLLMVTQNMTMSWKTGKKTWKKRYLYLNY